MNCHLTRSFWGAILVAWFAPCLCLVTAPPARAGADAESTLRDFDARWSEAAGARDVEKTVSFYSNDALILPPNAVAAQTKEAIRAAWKEMLETPGLSISWKATKVEVAKSGELAYISGTYEIQMKDAAGKPANDRGKYLEIMKKQTDGSWKCTVDIWNSDLPPARPTP